MVSKIVDVHVGLLAFTSNPTKGIKAHLAYIERYTVHTPFVLHRYCTVPYHDAGGCGCEVSFHPIFTHETVRRWTPPVPFTVFLWKKTFSD